MSLIIVSTKFAVVVIAVTPPEDVDEVVGLGGETDCEALVEDGEDEVPAFEFACAST